MKCYFALSDYVSNNDSYYYMFLAAINSAKMNTTLELHCLYDFRKTFVSDIEEDRIYRLLKENNVVIHLISIDFEKELLDVYTDDYLAAHNVTKSSLYSRFLRFMIADVEQEDEIILYADTDLIFYKDIPNLKTKTIAVCPEFSKSKNFSYFNAGVMLINTASYKDAKVKFLSMLKEKKHPSIECCDQGYLNDIYKDSFEKLDLTYNWKPYWGENKNAVIVHLHGVKPAVKLDRFDYGYAEWISVLLHNDKNAGGGYYYYFAEFVKYTNLPELLPIVITNLTLILETQQVENFSFANRVARKVKRILGFKK